MAFLTALALLAAAVIVVATVIFVLACSPRRWSRVASVAGLVSLAAGIALSLGSALIGLNYDEGGAKPAWLTAVGLAAVALGAVGLFAIVSSAVGAVRRR